MTQRNVITLSGLQTRPRHVFVLIVMLTLTGCAGLSSDSDKVLGGINPDYIFGDRRPGTDTPLVNDADYAEYLEWKQWQDFQAYQKWRSLREEEGEIQGDVDTD